MLKTILQVLALTALIEVPAQAYLSTIDTADLLDPGHYQFSVEPQVITGDTALMNFTGRFDAGIGENSSVRALLGGGSYSPLEWGLFYKWAPIPDLDEQPGISIMGGFLLARKNEKNVFNFRVHPIVSKRFTGDFGAVIPYIAVPVGVQVVESKTTYPTHLALGTEIRPEAWTGMSVFVEGGINVADAFNYISAALVFWFDEQNAK
jgi:hypothetical protein